MKIKKKNLIYEISFWFVSLNSIIPRIIRYKKLSFFFLILCVKKFQINSPDWIDVFSKICIFSLKSERLSLFLVKNNYKLT